MTPIKGSRLAGVLSALAVAAGCAACTSGPSEPADPPAGGTPPAVTFTATVAKRGEALHITYDLVNAAAGNLVVFNRLPATMKDGNPAAVYVVGGKPEGRVQIAKRAFAEPEGNKTNLATTPLIGVTRLEPGQSAHEEFDVALPLQRLHPYGNDYGAGPIALPDPVKDVVFCVGAARETDLPPVRPAPTAVGDGLILSHTEAVTKAQHLWCSDPAPM